MIYATHCKFCKRPISLEIDDEYAKLGDPYKLLGFACCNSCGDLREHRRTLTDKIRRAANAFAAIHNPSEASKDNARKSLDVLCRKYAEVVAQFHGKDGCCWDDGVVEAILENPRSWGEALSRLWTMYRQWEKDQRAEQEARMV